MFHLIMQDYGFQSIDSIFFTWPHLSFCLLVANHMYDTLPLLSTKSACQLTRNISTFNW